MAQKWMSVVSAQESISHFLGDVIRLTLKISCGHLTSSQSDTFSPVSRILMLGLINALTQLLLCLKGLREAEA